MASLISAGNASDKRWGRIGDSPVIGAGTYANAACAMSFNTDGMFRGWIGAGGVPQVAIWREA